MVMTSQITKSSGSETLRTKGSSETGRQGQVPPDDEKQISTPLATSSSTPTMDDLPSSAAASSAAPQVRSRITVVCAECKRLKLKCDRRTPCGSCTKRDTVSRCIYSPAAAEKVDLHSINNRLIQVETLLAMITAGKTPPPFQSSYPLAQVPLTTPHSATSRPNHAAVSNTVSPISIRMHDLVNIWLAHCQLDIFSPGDQSLPKPENSLDGHHVKQESTPIELRQLSGFSSEDAIIIDDPLTNENITLATNQDLPPLHLYHTTAHLHEEVSYLSRSVDYSTSENDSNSSQHSALSTSPSRQPTATDIFSYLPPPGFRSSLLSSALSATPHLSLLIHWQRVVEMADPAVAAAREEKERQKNLANAVFLGTCASPPPLSSHSRRSANSLPLFACMCYLLALGALEQPSETSDHTFLYALAGQAMGVWEEFITSTDAAEAREDQGTGETSVDASQVDHKEKEDLDYVVALLLQIKYLLRAGPSASSKESLVIVFPLIGKLVNAARGVGLARDPEDDNGLRRSVKADERRRAIWWDIMFYDTFASDILEHAPILSTYSYTTKIPAVARPPRSLTSSCRGSSGHNDAAGVVQGGIDNASTEQAGEEPCVERQPASERPNGASKAHTSRSIPPPKAKAKSKSLSSDQDDGETGFFGVRCRLTHLAQSLKHRLANPGCDCCTCGNGYSLDQAAKMESEIRAWAANLPSPLRLEIPSSSTTSSSKSSPKNTAVAAELAVLANRMVIAAYLPLMRSSPDRGESSKTNVYSAAHSWTPVSRATVDAAHGVVRAARVLNRLVQNGNVVPFMGGFYPLQKAVIDALVICAHSGIVATKPGRTTASIEEVNIALELLGVIGTPKGEMGRIVVSLRRRIESRKGTEENSLKRKHSVLDVSPHTEPSLEHEEKVEGEWESGPSMPPPQHHQQHHPATAPHLHRPEPIPCGKGSDKKHGKKVSYPAVGFRARGKDSAPWMMKKLNGSNKSDGSQHVSERRPSGDHFSPSPVHDAQINFQASPQQVSHPQYQNVAEDEYHSRVSSISHPPHPQTVGYSTRYVEEHDDDVRASQRRRFSADDIGQQQHQQHELPQQLSAVSPASHYAPSQPSRASSFENLHTHEHHPGAFDQGSNSSDGAYGSPSSPSFPMSNTSLSTASSPYGMTPVHQQAPPSYSAAPLDHNPSTFPPQPHTSNPPKYYQVPSGYDTTYVGQPPPQPLGASTVNPMESSMPMQSQMPTGEAMPASHPLPSTPIYEKTQQQAMYESKSPLEMAQQQQQHHMHHYRVAGDATPMNTSAPQAWPPTTQYMPQQQPLVGQQDAQYWTTSQVYYQ